MQFATATEWCDLELLPKGEAPQGYGIAARKNAFGIGSSLIDDQFDAALLELHESGFMDDLRTEWFRESSKCVDEKEDRNANVHQLVNFCLYRNCFFVSNKLTKVQKTVEQMGGIFLVFTIVVSMVRFSIFVILNSSLIRCFKCF